MFLCFYNFRRAVKDMDRAFPISMACNMKQFEAAKVMLFSLHCSKSRLDADWHGLAITDVRDEWIKDIINFHKLFLGWNVLQQLPETISALTNLVELDLQHNNLKTIPACLLELPQLQSLNISFNWLQDFPPVHQWSSSIHNLQLQGNVLQTFPDNVDGACIKTLNISKNKLFEVPSSVFKIATLTSLDISENRDIDELPIEFGTLPNLLYLNATNTQVSVTNYIF